MVHKGKSKRKKVKSGRHTDRDLVLISAEGTDISENGDLDSKIIRAVAIVGKVGNNELSKLVPYLGPEYDGSPLEGRMRRLVREEELRYERKFYRLNM